MIAVDSGTAQAVGSDVDMYVEVAQYWLERTGAGAHYLLGVGCAQDLLGARAQY